MKYSEKLDTFLGQRGLLEMANKDYPNYFFSFVRDSDESANSRIAEVGDDCVVFQLYDDRWIIIPLNLLTVGYSE